MFEVRVIPGASRLSLELKRSALVSPTDPTEKVRVWVAPQTGRRIRPFSLFSEIGIIGPFL